LPYFYTITFNLSFEETKAKSNLAVICTRIIFILTITIIREMIKDLENIKGDLANYKTIPIIYGETTSKKK
jgi:4-hydroxybenzoate polyprenyltransferase